jgi:hypothetical protein
MLAPRHIEHTLDDPAEVASAMDKESLQVRVLVPLDRSAPAHARL